MIKLAARSNLGDPVSAFHSGLSEQIERQNDAGAVTAADAKIVKPVNIGGGWSEYVISLAALSGRVYPADLDGFAVVYSRDGSTPGAVLNFDFGGGGNLATVRPGQHYLGRFSKLTVGLGAANLVTAGTARLLVCRTPLVDYRELPTGGFEGGPSEVAISDAASVGGIATYNAAAFGANAPTVVTEGIALNGAKGVRFVVRKEGGATILTGSIRMWYWSFTDLVWLPTDTEFQLVAGGVGSVTSDLAMFVPYGRVYPELIGYTDTGGTIGPTLRTQIWGA